MIKYTERTLYPRNASDMLKLFVNPNFIQQKYADSGATDIEILSLDFSNERFSIKVSRKVAVDVPVPAFASSLVPKTITLIQTDTWDLSTQTGSLDIQFQGIPVAVRCDMSLQDSAHGSVQELNFHLKVSVPLIGGKLEKLLSDDLRGKSAKDTEVTLALLSQIRTCSQPAP